MLPNEIDILMKSAQCMKDWQGWVHYKGMELPLVSQLASDVEDLAAQGYVELDIAWGAGWYRVNVQNILNLLK
jgi:hypothetical protein